MPKLSTDLHDPRTTIYIKGARVHNLKNVDVALPRNKLVVITGLSGSGKSSLAFDTLYAEGQRRYVESLSSYARQFLGRINKPDVDFIQGISPAVAIEQKVNSTNPRSTVGTSTEIYDYMKLLFARIGKTISPVSGEQVFRSTPADVVDFINTQPKGAKVSIYAPLNNDRFDNKPANLSLLRQLGFSRMRIGQELKRIEDWENDGKTLKGKTLELLIDRFVVNQEDEDNNSRISDSVQTTFYEGNNECIVEVVLEDGTILTKRMNNRFEADGIVFEEPSVHLFSFNNPFGACKTCEGFGTVIGIDEGLVVPDKSLSVYEGCVAPWKGEKMSEWRDNFVKYAMKVDFPVHRAYYDLDENQLDQLWNGTPHAEGINAFFHYVEEQAYKIQYRVMLSRYRGKTSCPDCKGTRLRKDAGYVQVGGKSIIELVLMSIDRVKAFFDQVELDEYQAQVAKRVLVEIQSRLGFLCDVGLGYLTLNRLSSTLSGGESQRINLATSIGSALEGSLYVLDEPSIGLHSRDTDRLITILKRLRDLGNTVIVVEHDEEIMKAADVLIDMGPEAGTHGGNVVFQGVHADLITAGNSLTADYLTGRKEIALPAKSRKWNQSIQIKGARHNNLKSVDATFPLGVMTVISGVSGSGKSSLVNKILYPALKKMFEGYSEQTGQFDRLEGDYRSIGAVEYIDQNPIGKSSRSNPVTYVKAYDEIRTLYSIQPVAKTRGYKPSAFSFNVEGGRCEECEGEGFVTISMQFMADIKLQCDVCNGKRFKDEILEVEYNGKNIYNILEMTVEDAINFFSNGKNVATDQRIVAKLQPLADVGLGYVHLGQASSTLSGGEAQRIKLASFLTKGSSAVHTLFIFDEPTTGLHFHDIRKLLDAFNALIAQGHSLVIIEHNLDVIKCADYVIDLGPEGGDTGGQVVFEGTPKDLAKREDLWTGRYLKEKFS
ncbi:MAG TPA: excinuclease ABC subunit UvrA [Flavobacteriales bacterium]|nr:excinuclease ABC subunit UvrA [Flavobacteriales bacterium]